MAFRVGERIECWTKDEGFLDSHYEAEVQSISGKRCLVKYMELLTEDGDRLIENLPLDQLRPLPPKIDPPGKDPNFLPGSSIEAYHQDGWWKGAVHKKVDKDHYLCYFLSNGVEQLQFHYRNLRTCQVWVDGAWIIKGAKGSQPQAPAAPQTSIRLKLPSPRTPDSPSAYDQTQRSNNPPAESSRSEGFVLGDDEEEDVDIENSWEGPPLRKTGGEVAATPQLPSDEEGTVSDPGSSPNRDELDRLPEGGVSGQPGTSGNLDLGGEKGTSCGDGEVSVQKVIAPRGTKRRQEADAREGSPSSKKPKKAPASAKKAKGVGGEPKTPKKRGRPKKNAIPGAAAVRDTYCSQDLETLPLVAHGSEIKKKQSPIRPKSGSQVPSRAVRSKPDAAGFGTSPFGRNVVMRWGTKQRSIDDIMRRSSVDFGDGNVSGYERECEVDRQRRELHKKAQASHEPARQLAPLQPCQRAFKQPRHLPPQEPSHLAPPEPRHLAPQQESSLTPYQESWKARWQGQEESGQGDPGGGWPEEQASLAIVSHGGGQDNAYYTPLARAEAPSERFSFRAAYGGILEAFLRKDMPGFRREYLLAELRTELRISDRCHEKQYQRALRRISEEVQ